MDTLVRDPFFTRMPAFFGLTLDELVAQKHPTTWRDFELGRIEERELYARFFRDGRAIDGPGLKRCMAEGYAWHDGMESTVRDLHARGVAMHGLSNYPPWVELCDARLGLSRYLSLRFVSFRTGTRKPDAQAYLGACASLGVPPGDCLFVDDRETNCAGARAVGMRTLHFRGDADALGAELRAHGLL
jgi:HAD superfamily hydrolase (TIGR01509 family)